MAFTLEKNKCMFVKTMRKSFKANGIYDEPAKKAKSNKKR